MESHQLPGAFLQDDLDSLLTDLMEEAELQMCGAADTLRLSQDTLALAPSELQAW